MRNLPAGKPTISSVIPLGRFSVNGVSFAGGGGGEEGAGGATLGNGVDVTVAIGNCVDVTLGTHTTRNPLPPSRLTLKRNAERQYLGALLQEPPRSM